MRPRTSPGSRTLELLWSDPGAVPDASSGIRGARIPAELRRAYGGRLLVPLRETRPTVIADFVSTLDGVVALDTAGASGGGEISGSFEPDRFVMGLLRSVADAVLVGSGTVRAAPGHRWTPGHVHPGSARAFAEWRARLGLPPQPTTIVVTASGDLDPAHPGLADPTIPVVILATAGGAARARRQGFGPHVLIEALGGDRVEPAAILSFVDSYRAGLVLCEGGPDLLSQFVDAGLLDELFLTVAPQLVGRGTGPTRLALLESDRSPLRAPHWGALQSVRRAGSHLFLRYTLAGEAPLTGTA